MKYAFGLKGFSVVGYTTEGQMVVSFFQLTNTHGLPLEVILDIFKKEDIVPDWISFFRDSVENGRSPDRVQLEMEVAIREVYGEEYYKSFNYKMTNWRRIERL